MRLITGFSRTSTDTTPSLKPIPTSAKSSVAKRSFSASSPRSAEPLIAGDDDLPDRAGAGLRRGGRGLDGRSRRRRLRGRSSAGLRDRGNRDSAEHGADEKCRAQPPVA
jgi:hypothetical protein